MEGSRVVIGHDVRRAVWARIKAPHLLRLD